MDEQEDIADVAKPAALIEEVPIKLKKPIVVKFPKRVPSVVIPKRKPVYITPDKTTCVQCTCFPKESPYRKPPKLKECLQSPITLYEHAASAVDRLPLPEALKWSEEEVAKWMAEVVGLPQYTECMLRNHIHGRTLLILENMNLSDLGIYVFEHIQMIVTAIHKLYSTEFIKFSRSIGLPPRKPLTHCTFFKSKTRPSWSIRQNWTRSDILRWMKILDPVPVKRDHWELVWYQKPDFPKTMFAKIPPSAPREEIPRFTDPPKPCKEYQTPRKYVLTSLPVEDQLIWNETAVILKSKKVQIRFPILSKTELRPEELVTPAIIVSTPEKKKKTWEQKESRLMPKKICLKGLTGKDLLLARRLMPKQKFFKV